MTVLTEKGHDAGFILSLASGNRSLESVALAASQTITAGAVLGKVTADGQHKVLAPSASNGTQAVAGIAYAGTTTVAGETPQITLIARDAEVNQHELVWPTGITDSQKTTAISELSALGILVR